MHNLCYVMFILHTKANCQSNSVFQYYGVFFELVFCSFFVESVHDLSLKQDIQPWT